MHPLFQRADKLTENIIGAAIEVHRELGPGLLESVYEWALACELRMRGLPVSNQEVVKVGYKGFVREEPMRCDLLVDACVLVEAKAVAGILPIHHAQVLSYMKLLNVPVGLLINFNVARLVEGVHRLIIPGANRGARAQHNWRLSRQRTAGS